MKSMSVGSLRQSSLAIAVVAVICGASAIGGASAATSGMGRAGTAAETTLLQRGDAIIGALPMSEPIPVEVSLKLRNNEALDSFIANTAKNQFGAVAEPMSHEQFMANHAPTQQQAERVANYLVDMGYRNVVIAPNRLLVSADGTAATARNAFMTSFAQVKTGDGRIAFANTNDALVPLALQDTVQAVVGLQNVNRMHTFAHALPAVPQLGGTVTTHFPTEFSTIYGGTGVATAAGVTVGIITSGSLTQTINDLGIFTAEHGLTAVAHQTVNTGGTSTSTSNVDEWDLDSQTIVGMAGGKVGKIIFYNTPSLDDSDLTANFNKVVTANVAKVINVSLGGCEGSASGAVATAEDAIFKTGVAQGQTFVASVGSPDECGNGSTSPSWPASSQYVIAVGGTTLSTGSADAWSKETVYPNSGGGPSAFEPKPIWQNALVTGTKRGTPDVAFDGDPNSGAMIVINGKAMQLGGTDLSAPIFAGWWARVIAVKGTAVGFAGPLLYALPAADFHDITSGNNGFPAKVGWDYASGRGSVILSSAIPAL